MLDTPTEFTPLHDMSKLEPKLRQLLDYWEIKRGEGCLPGRADIDPIDIPRIMPDVAFVDILRDPLDYRYRLVGTRLVQMMGGERTGRRMREIFTPPAIEATVHLMERLIGTSGPLSFEGRMYWIDRNYRQFQALILPLAADGVVVDMAIMGLHFYS